MEVVLTLAETNRLRVAHGLKPIPEPRVLSALVLGEEEHEAPVEAKEAWTIEGATVLDGVREALLDDWLADLGTTKHSRADVPVNLSTEGLVAPGAEPTLVPINHTLEQIRSMESGEVLTVDADVLDEEEEGVALASVGGRGAGGFSTGEVIDLTGQDAMASEMVVTHNGVETRRRRVLFTFQDDELEPEMGIRKRRKGKGRSRRGRESTPAEVPLGIAGTFEDEDDGRISVVVARPVKRVERVAVKSLFGSDVSWVDTLVKAVDVPSAGALPPMDVPSAGALPPMDVPSAGTPPSTEALLKEPLEIHAVAVPPPTTPSFSSLSSTLEFLKSRNALPATHSLDGRLHAHRVALSQAQRNTTSHDSAALLDDANERLEHYAPEVRIEYKDEDGKEVDTKGAFKVLSRRFHGTKGKRSRKPASPQSLLDG